MSFEFFTRDFPGKKIEWKKFLKGFLWKIEAGFTPALVLKLSLILAIDLLPPCLWSEKWVSEWVSEVKWCLFWSLNFFIFRYVEGGVLGNNYISIKKCTTTFLWVLNFGQVGEILENFQKHPLGESFWKMVSKVIFWKNY